MWDDDQFGSLEVYMLCVMMMSLEVWRFTHCVCDDWEFRSLEVRKFQILHIVFDVDKFGSSEVYQFTYFAMMISLEVRKFTHSM